MFYQMKRIGYSRIVDIEIYKFLEEVNYRFRRYKATFTFMLDRTFNSSYMWGWARELEEKTERLLIERGAIPKKLNISVEYDNDKFYILAKGEYTRLWLLGLKTRWENEANGFTGTLNRNGSFRLSKAVSEGGRNFFPSIINSSYLVDIPEEDSHYDFGHIFLSLFKGPGHYEREDKEKFFECLK